MASKLRESALAVIDAFNAWDLDKIMSLRSPECLLDVLPKKGRQPRTNDEFQAHLKTLIPIFKDFTITVIDMIVNEHQNKVAVWATSTATTPVGPYANELMIFFHFDEKAEKLVRMQEFVDASLATTFYPKLREYMAEQAAAK